MSSQAFASSPVSPNTRRKRRSAFTYKHLSTLAQSATNCPLRVIAHIDLDAFYAQCETVRLGIDPSRPLAVQQWQGLIAINYPARAFGLSRHVPITEAREKCPEIICQHVATWKEGDTQWSYSEDAHKEIATRKVSLDPYRVQSRRILAVIKDSLPKELQRVEKASIDEVFLDLSAQVHAELIKRYPELEGPAPYDDPTEPLPRPPTTALDWAADALIDLDSNYSEEDDPDWDDIVMLIASEIVRDVRKQVFDQLQYTCSAGISKNKMLAKLASGHKKPNSQTVVRNRAVQHFLSEMKFTKIRNLGGKLGDEVVAAFNTDAVSDLLPVSLEQFKKQLGDDTGSWLYGTIRGEDNSEVKERTALKSMLSAKSFRPSINSFESACKWLRIFVADIYGRLIEEGVLENKRRPKTMTLHHRQGQQTRSKQIPISLGRSITEEGLFDLSKTLLGQVIVDGRAWPCSNLSLSVGGFEDAVTGNKGIGGFLVRGDEAKALNANVVVEEPPDFEPSNKRRRIGDSSGITRFLAGAAKQDSTNSGGDSDADHGGGDVVGSMVEGQDVPRGEDAFDPHEPPPSAQRHSAAASSTKERETVQTELDMYICPRCSNQVAEADRPEHDDFHFAQDLQEQQSSPPRPPPKPNSPMNHSARGGASRGRGKPAGRGGSIEKGQRKLAFG